MQRNRPRLIPVLLLKDQGLYKTRQFGKYSYVGDPINTIRIFNDKEVDEIVILDIRAARERTPVNYELLRDIASECFVPLSYGGGVNDVETVQSLISIGFERVIVNTTAVENIDIVRNMTSRFGSSTIIGGIDVKKTLLGKKIVVAKGGAQKTKLSPIRWMQQLQDAGVGEILVTSVDRDGEMIGYDLELLKTLSAQSDVPIIACGGAANLQDLKSAYDAGASGAAGGAMFVYKGKHRAVLIQYPKPSEIEDAFSK